MSGHRSLAVKGGGQCPCVILEDRSNDPLCEHADIVHWRLVNTDNLSLFDRTMEGGKYCDKYKTLQSTAFDRCSRGGNGLAKNAMEGSDNKDATKGGDRLNGTVVGQ